LGGKKVCVPKVIDGSIVLSGIESFDDSEVPFTINKPNSIPYGLLSFRLDVVPGQRAVVIVYLSEPAPEGAYWVHYDEENGWVDYSEHTRFTAKRDVVFLEFLDGGYGDSDRTVNGIIIDPSGLASDTDLSETGDDNKKELGSRVLFRIPVEIGVYFARHHGVSMMFDHVSNAYLADPNEGLDTIGLRYSYRF